MVIGMREDAGRRMASGHIAKNTGMAQRVSGHPKAHPYITGGELNEGCLALSSIDSLPFTVAHGGEYLSSTTSHAPKLFMTDISSRSTTPP